MPIEFIDDTIFTCRYCGERGDGDELTKIEEDGGYYVCKWHFITLFRTCAHCGEIVGKNDFVRTDDNKILCCSMCTGPSYKRGLGYD